MLQVPFIEENRDQTIKGLEKRGLPDAEEKLNEIISLNSERKDTQTRLDEVLFLSNKMAKEIGQLFKEGKKDEANAAKEKTGQLKAESKELSEHLAQLENQLSEKLYEIPNVPNEMVPAGHSETDNEIIKTTDSLPKLDSAALPHWDLIDQYDLIDFELGNKITGAGFPVYKGKGARLVRGMINYFLDVALEAGYNEIQPPVVINEESGLGTGQLPDKEGQMYHLSDSNLYLIPTAEVPITNLYRDTIVPEKELPLKLCGYTPCFRREAGSWGSHVRGLNRLHQFDKVEIVQIVPPELSYEVLDEMVAHVESLVASLGLPYRILRLCAGDLGFTSALTYDFEVYSAAQEKWLEVSSVSNFETYQANRLKLRYKNKEGKKQLAHTLNGSALALPRILAAILENNQSDSGISIPEKLVPYVGFDKIEKL